MGDMSDRLLVSDASGPLLHMVLCLLGWGIIVTLICITITITITITIINPLMYSH